MCYSVHCLEPEITLCSEATGLQSIAQGHVCLHSIELNDQITPSYIDVVLCASWQARAVQALAPI